MTTPHTAGSPHSGPHPPPAGTDRSTTEPLPEGGGVELFPINFTAYRHHDDLETDRYVQAIADLLAPYGVRLTPWTVSADARDRQAVEDRLGAWKPPTASHGGNTVLYWVGHGSADHLAHHRTPAPIDDGVSPHDIARAIASRQLHSDNADSWAVVVLDACFSKSFAESVHLELFTKYRDAGRYLLLSTAAKGYAELGAFTRALDRALSITFPTKSAIGLASLGRQLRRDLGGFCDDLTVDDQRDQLVSPTVKAASAVSAPLDQLAELQAVIDQLPIDEQRHFLPKASGAELGELAWYFQGRTLERDRILHWLTTTPCGTLVVTGPAGSGKSALLGHILLHTNTYLRDVLIRHGHLHPLPAGTPCPEDPFDLVAHLAGLTLTRTLHLIAEAAGLTDLARQVTDGHPPADLTTELLSRLRDRQTALTLLFDALDEAEQPLTIADQLLRPLASLPTVRLIVGTRRSTCEGPDQSAPTDNDILDALQPRPATPDGLTSGDLQCLEVSRDPEALAGYLRGKLHAAQYRGTLNADDTQIAAAVRRLVTDRQNNGAEPQQFLYARLAAHELLNDPDLITDPTPLIGQTHRQLFARALERLHRCAPHYTPLLQALGFAQGRGLPDRDGIWAHTSDALTTTPDSIGDSIPNLLRDAAPYLALDQEHDQSVYRLAHRTFTEHFTTAPDSAQAHAAITTALVHHARHTLENTNTRGDTNSQPEGVNPYIRHHLATHVRLGHTAGALHTLADHTDVLDTLDLASVTTALHYNLTTNDLPPAIAGTVLLQHHARDTAPEQQTGTATGWRRWWRRLGTTYIQGTPPPAEPHPRDTGQWPPTLTAGTVQTRQLHLQLIGHTNLVTAVAAFTAPDGTPRLATASYDNTVRIWNPANGTPVGPPLTGHTSRMQVVAAFTAPDGAFRLAMGGDDHTVQIWDPDTGTQVGPSLTGHTNGVNAMAVFTAPDGTSRLATVGDNKMRFWNPATGTQVGRPLTGQPYWASAMTVFTAPDGTPRLATASYDHTVRIWNPATGTQVGRPLTGHTDKVRAMAAFTAPNGTPRLATGGDDLTVRIWDPATGTQVGPPLTGHTDKVRAMAAFTAPNGTPCLATASNNTVEIWDPTTGTQVGPPLTGHTDKVRAMAAFTAPNGTFSLVTGGDDHTVRIWNPATGTQVRPPLIRYRDGVTAVAMFTAPDGTLLLATGGKDTVEIWDPATGTQVGPPMTGYFDKVRAMAAFTAPDGTFRLVTGGDDHTVRIWNPATGAQVGPPLIRYRDGVTAVAMFTAPDGTPRLATASYDHTVRIWNPATRTQDGPPLTGHTDAVRAVAAFTAPDGTTGLATASDDHTVRIWNPATRTQVGPPLTGHTDAVQAMAAFTVSDGTPRLATAGHDKTVRIWNPQSRTGHPLPLADQVHALTEHHGLLIAGTTSGYLTIDISSVPGDCADADLPNTPARTPEAP